MNRSGRGSWLLTLVTLVSLVATAALLSACGGGDDPTSEPRPSADGSAHDTTATTDEPTSDSAASDALELTASAITGTTCFTEDLGDLAWIQFRLRARKPVTSFDFVLKGSGLRQVGQPEMVPFRRSATFLDVSAVVGWDARLDTYDTPDTVSDGVKRADRVSLRKGDQALVSFRIRLDQDVVDGKVDAIIRGVTVDYATGGKIPAGGTVLLKLDETLTFRDLCSD